MGVASLGFGDGSGPSITFRIDPDSVEWNFKVNTTVTDTVAGRVVQVLGATLSDMTVHGLYGQNVRDPDNGLSWQQAEMFAEKIRQIMEYQSRDATDHGKMHPPATFNYSPRGWRFGVYVKALNDSKGGTVSHEVGRASYDFSLALFIVDARSQELMPAGTVRGSLDKARQTAIDAYIARISDGIGWHFSQFNGVVPASPTGGLFGQKKFDPKTGAAAPQTPDTGSGATAPTPTK